MNYAIVVDASVARSASPHSGIDEARCCWMSLDGIKGGGYRLAMSRAIYDEWLRVAAERPQNEWRYYVSRHAMAWLTEMRSRDRVEWVDPYGEPSFRSAVFAAVGDARIRKTEKDLHLVEAALAADYRVVSCDREIARILDNAAGQVACLGLIVWVHPLDDDGPQWLADGARDLPGLRLGYRQGNRSP